MSTNLNALTPTLTVRETAELLGMGLRQTYEAIGRKEIRALRMGGRWIVPTSGVLELLGLDVGRYLRPPADASAEAGGVDGVPVVPGAAAVDVREVVAPLSVVWSYGAAGGVGA